MQPSSAPISCHPPLLSVPALELSPGRSPAPLPLSPPSDLQPDPSRLPLLLPSPSLPPPGSSSTPPLLAPTSILPWCASPPLASPLVPPGSLYTSLPAARCLLPWPLPLGLALKFPALPPPLLLASLGVLLCGAPPWLLLGPAPPPVPGLLPAPGPRVPLWPLLPRVLARPRSAACGTCKQVVDERSRKSCSLPGGDGTAKQT